MAVYFHALMLPCGTLLPCLALTNFPNALLCLGLEKECLGLALALRKMH